MAYRLSYSQDAREQIARFDMPKERRLTLALSEIIANPFPRSGLGFHIVATQNQFGDRYLNLVVADFDFIVQYDVFPWQKDASNPFGYEGRVHVFALVPHTFDRG